MKLPTYNKVFFFSYRAVIGMVTLGNLMQKMVSGKLTPESPVQEALYKNFHKVRINPTE